MAEKRAAKVRQIGTAFLAGDPPPDINYERGYFAGMEFLLGSPERVESQLERALRRQENTEGDRDAV